MQLLNNKHGGPAAGSKGSFERQQVVKGPPIPIAQRMAVCPTVKSFHPLWGTIQHVEAPGPNELVHFKAKQGAAQHAAAPDELARMGSEARAIIDQHLLETGTLLLQGLPITNPETCEAFVNGMGFTSQKYEPYGGTRQKIRSLDAATNVGPAELLDLHNEMCYNPRPNRKIILICLKPADEGGESLMGDSAAIAAAMPEFVLQRFQDRGGVLYTRRYVSAAAAKAGGDDGPPALTWQDRTGFSDPAAAAGFFKDLGFTVEWQESDTLVATHVAPPVVPHPVTGQPVWFNLTHLAVPGYTEYANGSPIEPDAVEAISVARLSATRAMMLGTGDVLVMDNYRAAHGRLPYNPASVRTLVAVLTSD